MNDREGSTVAAILDGTSHTLMVSECANRPQLWVLGRKRTDITADTSNYPAGLVGPGETTGGVWAEHQKAVSVGGASGDGTTTIGGGPCAINCTNDWEIYADAPRRRERAVRRWLGSISGRQHADHAPGRPLQPSRRRRDRLPVMATGRLSERTRPVPARSGALGDLEQPRSRVMITGRCNPAWGKPSSLYATYYAGTETAAVTLYLAYIGFAGGLTGMLLWPAVVWHVILTRLLTWASISHKGTKT